MPATERGTTHAFGGRPTDATLLKPRGAAVGFLVTAEYTNDWSRRLYAAAVVATLGGAVLVVTVQPFESVHYLAAAVVQGLPMLYHGTRLN